MYTHTNTYDSPFATLPHTSTASTLCHKAYTPFLFYYFLQYFYLFLPSSLLYKTIACVCALVYAFKLLPAPHFYASILSFASIFFPHFFACFVYITLFCTTWRTMATRNTKGTSKRKKDFIYICEKKEI